MPKTSKYGQAQLVWIDRGVLGPTLLQACMSVVFLFAVIDTLFVEFM